MTNRMVEPSPLLQAELYSPGCPEIGSTMREGREHRLPSSGCARCKAPTLWGRRRGITAVVQTSSGWIVFGRDWHVVLSSQPPRAATGRERGTT